MKRRVKTILATYTIALNIVVISTLLVCFLKGGFDADQFTTLIAIVAPMFACYGVAAVRFIASEKQKSSDKETVSAGFALALIAFLVPFVFAIFILAMIVIQASGTAATNFEQFKRILLIFEAIFSAFAGEILYRLFDRGESPRSPVGEDESIRNRLN